MYSRRGVPEFCSCRPSASARSRARTSAPGVCGVRAPRHADNGDGDTHGPPLSPRAPPPSKRGNDGNNRLGRRPTVKRRERPRQHFAGATTAVIVAVPPRRFRNGHRASNVFPVGRHTLTQVGTARIIIVTFFVYVTRVTNTCVRKVFFSQTRTRRRRIFVFSLERIEQAAYGFA